MSKTQGVHTSFISVWDKRVTHHILSLSRSDFVTSYFLAFSNDSREWTTIHDGYADWVNPPAIIPLPWAPSPVFSPGWLVLSLSSSCSLETAIKTLQWWTSWLSRCWLATWGSSLRAGTAPYVWGWKCWAARCLVSLWHRNPQTPCMGLKPVQLITKTLWIYFPFDRSSWSPVQAKWSDSSWLLEVQASQLSRDGCSEYHHTLSTESLW